MADSDRDRLARAVIDAAFSAVVAEQQADVDKCEAALRAARKDLQRAQERRRAWRRQGKFDYVLGLRALALAQGADLGQSGGPSDTHLRALASYLAEYHPTTEARKVAPMHAVRRGSGKPLLLVHGLGSSWRNWDPVAPALSAQREVIAVDLPGFGETPPLSGEVTIATLTDAVADFIKAEGLGEVDVVGSSMGARMVLEMARRGHAGNIVALDPGGFWSDGQAKVFNASITASVALIRHIQPALPLLTSSPAGRTALLAQFSAKPWKLPADLVLTELRAFKAARGLDEALSSLVHGPRQRGAPAGSVHAKLVIGWGRQDKVTLPSESKRALELFPDATLHWFDKCGHFPHWDQPDQVVDLILASTR